MFSNWALIDTDIMINFIEKEIAQDRDFVIWLLKEKRFKVAITSVTLMEIYKGVRGSHQLEGIEKTIKDLRKLGLKIIKINQKSSHKAVDLMRSYCLKYQAGKTEGLICDRLIAAITLNLKKAILFTHNLGDFNYIKGLKVKNLEEALQ